MDAPSGGAGSSPPPHIRTSSDNTKLVDSLFIPGYLSGKDQGTEPANNEAENSTACDATVKDKGVNQKAPTS